MVDMMVADVGRHPSPKGVQHHEAGRLQRGVVVAPLDVPLEGDSREVVLGVEQVGPDGTGDREGDDDGKEKRLPAQKHGDGDDKGGMEGEGDRRIVVPPRAAAKRLDAHSVQEHRHVPAGDRQRMAHGEVCQPFGPGCFQELLSGVDRVGSDAGTEQFGVVVVVIIVRAFPDARGGEDVQPKQGEDDVRRDRLAEDGVVLVVVVDDEHSHEEQPAADAGKSLQHRMSPPEGPDGEQRQQGEGAERIQTALPFHFHGKRPSGQDQISACSHDDSPRRRRCQRGFTGVMSDARFSIPDATTAGLQVA